MESAEKRIDDTEERADGESGLKSEEWDKPREFREDQQWDSIDDHEW